MFRGLIHISHRTLQLMWIVVNTVAMGIFVFAAYGGYIPPSKFVFAQSLNLAFPIILLAGLLLLVVNLLLWRKVALGWTVLMLLCVGPILTVCPLNFSRPVIIESADSSRVFTVLSYNVFGFNDYNNPNEQEFSPTMQYVIDKNADIVCVQEPTLLFDSTSDKFKPQRRELRKLYPYRTRLLANNEAVLSKYPIVDITPDQPRWGSGGYVAYRLNVEGHDLIVVSVHLQSIGLKEDERERYSELAEDIGDSPRADLSFVRRTLLSKLHEAFRVHASQVHHIVNFVDSIAPNRDSNVIIAGDFNDVPGSYAYRTLCNRLSLNDAYVKVGFGPMVTYNRHRFYFHIDQILYRGSMKAVDIDRGSLLSSDHYPLLATFIWENH